MIFAECVKSSLLSLIKEMASVPWLFSKNPDADFSRSRKLDFASTIQFILSMENGRKNTVLLTWLTLRLVKGKPIPCFLRSLS